MVEQRYIDYWRQLQAKQADKSMMLAQQAWADVQQIAKLLRSEFGATQIIVFGSLVKGESFDAQSDIDLAVKGILPQRYFTAVTAANQMSHHWIDLKPIEALDPHFLQKVLKSGKNIYAEN